MMERFVHRELLLEDYDKGFLHLLSQLTTVGTVRKEAFLERLQQIRTRGDRVLVIEDKENEKLVACGTLIFEYKFVHECGVAGHIEDVVVDSSYRDQHLGKTLIRRLVTLAEQEGCYKVILDCAEDNVGFYEKCGLTRKEIQMVKYFK
eukprot:g9081.t1